MESKMGMGMWSSDAKWSVRCVSVPWEVVRE